MKTWLFIAQLSCALSARTASSPSGEGEPKTRQDDQIIDFIDEVFKVNMADGLGGFLKDNVKQDVTWEACTDFTWGHLGASPLDNENVVQMITDLGGEACLNTSFPAFFDATCAAARALLTIAPQIEDMYKKGPKFANYSLVAWGKHPSWVNGSVTKLDYSDLPPTARLVNPAGIIGYASCDILRTVLTQSVNQMSTGTCSWVASLGALSHKAPAVAIKLGLRLLWTGQITKSTGPACPKIFEQQPGLIPWEDEGHWRPPFFSGNGQSACAGNEADCASSQGRPTQNVGLTFMWSQTQMSNWMAHNWNGCGPDARAGLLWPGQSKAEAAVATQNQGGGYSSMMWSCRSVLDPVKDSCRLLINPNTAGDLPLDLFTKKVALEPASEVMDMLIAPAVDKYWAEAFQKDIVDAVEVEQYVLRKMRAEFSSGNSYPAILGYMDLLENVASNSNKTALDVHTNYQAPFFPSFTEELLEKTCKAFTNLIIIDATVLSAALSLPEKMVSLKKQKLPFFGNHKSQATGTVFDKSDGCNHAVYLEHCDFEENNFVMWTWGTRVNLTKEVILGWPTSQPEAGPTSGSWTWNTGSVCGAIVADQITVADAPDTPRAWTIPSHPM